MKIQKQDRSHCTLQFRHRLILNKRCTSEISLPHKNHFQKEWHYLGLFIIAHNLACSFLNYNCVFLYTCILFCLLLNKFRISSYSLLFFTPFHLSIAQPDSPSLVKPSPVSQAEVDDLASPSSLTKLYSF